MKQLHGVITLATLAVFALLAGCERPIHDPSTLKTIRAEARALMRTRRDQFGVIPENRWPHGIAGLRPETVTVYPDGVDISIKAGFDGGWGYFIPRRPDHAPEPAGRFSEVSEGVHWYSPY